jgi:hypothetical protein
MCGQMMVSKRSRSSLLMRSKGKLLALLLVGTLLMCHGVFGALHLCSAPLVPAHQDHEHPPPAEKEMVAHEHSLCHLAGADYFAVLFTAFLGLILGLLLKGAGPRVSVIAPLTAGRRFTPVVLHPPRGPTLPLLQVFRL